jgi:Fe-S-cluster containining protein
MQSSDAGDVESLYHLFDNVTFSECDSCTKCCFFPWLLKEEQPIQVQNFGDEGIRKVAGTLFILDETHCKFAKDSRCHAYASRPLDCRMFPLDIIEEDGKYYWCIFTICPKHGELMQKLVALIPQLEALITDEIFDQYKRQIAVTKEMYPPYKLKQYEKIRPFRAADLRPSRWP